MDGPARQHPIVNPEKAVACLRRLVKAWDRDDREAFIETIAEAHRLLAIPPVITREPS